MRIRLRTDKTQWHKKFLWFPRILDDHFVWLETIETRRISGDWYAAIWEWRLCDPPKPERSDYDDYSIM